MSIPQEILSTIGVIRTPLLFRLLQIKQMNLHYQHATQVVKLYMHNWHANMLSVKEFLSTYENEITN
mgnify:CR=1 FL=1